MNCSGHHVHVRILRALYFNQGPLMLSCKESIYSTGPYPFTMKDKGTQKGKSRKPESSEAKPDAGTDAKAVPVRDAPLTAKQKIAANQKNKRRK
jgi:hypothetical protein